MRHPKDSSINHFIKVCQPTLILSSKYEKSMNPNLPIMNFLSKKQTLNMPVICL